MVLALIRLIKMDCDNSPMDWKRARQPDQKAKRVAAILQAASGLFDASDLSEISMRDVALKAELSKASLYSYFSTKEEVFATLFIHESEAWLAFVEPRLSRLRSASANRVSRILTDALREFPRFCRLTVIIASVLERNLSVDFIKIFKSDLNIVLGQIVIVLQRVFPNMTSAAGGAFLYQHQAIVAGLWPLTHPTPEMASVLASEEFKGLQFDFFELFQKTVEQLLQQFV